MKALRTLGIASVVSVALSGAAWAHSVNGNSGRGNDALQSVINLPQITTPLIHRSGSQHLAPVVTHKLPTNTLTDFPGNRGIGLRGPDIKDVRIDQGRDMGRGLGNLDRRQAVTKIDEKAEKAEQESATRLAANTADDASGSRKTELNQPQPTCR